MGLYNHIILTNFNESLSLEFKTYEINVSPQKKKQNKTKSNMRMKVSCFLFFLIILSKDTT